MLSRSLLALSLVSTLAACSHSSNSTSSNGSSPQGTTDKQASSNSSPEQVLSQRYLQVYIKCELSVTNSDDPSGPSGGEFGSTILQPPESVTMPSSSFDVKTLTSDTNASLSQPTLSIIDGVVTAHMHGTFDVTSLGGEESREIDEDLILLGPQDQGESSFQEQLGLNISLNGESHEISATVTCSPEYFKK